MFNLNMSKIQLQNSSNEVKLNFIEESCINFCKKDSKCKAFNWNFESNECQILKNANQELNFSISYEPFFSSGLRIAFTLVFLYFFYFYLLFFFIKV
jgi:hypothetical protein